MAQCCAVILHGQDSGEKWMFVTGVSKVISTVYLTNEVTNTTNMYGEILQRTCNASLLLAIQTLEIKINIIFFDSCNGVTEQL